MPSVTSTESTPEVRWATRPLAPDWIDSSLSGAHVMDAPPCHSRSDHPDQTNALNIATIVATIQDSSDDATGQFTLEMHHAEP